MHAYFTLKVGTTTTVRWRSTEVKESCSTLYHLLLLQWLLHFKHRCTHEYASAHTQHIETLKPQSLHLEAAVVPLSEKCCPASTLDKTNVQHQLVRKEK